MFKIVSLGGKMFKNDIKLVPIEQLQKTKNKKKKRTLCTAKLFQMFKQQLFPEIFLKFLYLKNETRIQRNQKKNKNK